MDVLTQTHWLAMFRIFRLVCDQPKTNLPCISPGHSGWPGG